MEGFDLPSIVAGGGPYAVIVIGVLAIIRGDLVSRKVHEGMIADRDRIIVATERDRDYYREQTLALLRVADTAADRMTQALLSRSIMARPDLTPRERGDT